MTFSLQGYCALLEALFARGYQVRDFFTVVAESRHVVLRHDVDVSLAAAVAMAEAEAAIGVRAGYFVRLSGEYYNLASPDGRAALGRLAELGHEIGLHFDATLYAEDLAALDEAAAAECVWLERLAACPVRILSFHRPAPALLEAARPLAGRANTYEPRFFRDIGYCSDSRGAFHHGDPLQHPALAQGRALQLLTHPIWWVGPPSMAVSERMEHFIAERGARLRAALMEEITSYGRAAAP